MRIKASVRMMKRFAGSLAAILTATLFLAGCGGGSAERDVVITQCNGSASVGNNGEKWEAYDGLNLVNGDVLSVEEGGDVTLLLDTDRHFFADGGSVFLLEMEGKPGKGRMILHMTIGRAVAGIDGKPKEKDPFTLATPDVAVTATKKGTVFSAEIEPDNGNSATTVTVTQGEAQVRTVLGGAERTQLLAAGESGSFVGTAPDLSAQSGQREKTAEASSDEASEEADNGHTGSTVEKTGEPLVDGMVTAYQWADAIREKSERAATKRAYETKLKGWMGLVDLPFTVDGLTLGESLLEEAASAYGGRGDFETGSLFDGEENVFGRRGEDAPEGDALSWSFGAETRSDLIRSVYIADPSFNCLEGLHAGDPEEAMWSFLGFHLDPLLADEQLSVKGEDGEALDISMQGFTYHRDGKMAAVTLADGMIRDVTLTLE